MRSLPIASKLRILADAAKYDASCASSGSNGRKEKGLGSTQGMGICHSYTPDGRCVSLLKVLMTNFCTFDCSYCINRRSSGVERATFEPEELVRLTMEFYRRNYIEGLFLSSGILKSPDTTMRRMIEVARRLRKREQFAGYIHLKAVAGAGSEAIEDAGVYADRVSVNIELPTAKDLQRLAPEKRSKQIKDNMGRLKERMDEDRAHRPQKRPSNRNRYAPAGQSTQMIIGATPSQDRSVLLTANNLYKRFSLRRVYYSGYSPIPFASNNLPAKPVPLRRENRLYQADWLLRYYEFSVDEVVPAESPQLDLDIDPKLAWALRNRHVFPIDLQTAPKSKLLRIPGLGVRNVSRILKARRHGPLHLADLRRMRVSLEKAAPFILTADRPTAALQNLDRLDLRALVAPKIQQLALPFRA